MKRRLLYIVIILNLFMLNYSQVKKKIYSDKELKKVKFYKWSSSDVPVPYPKKREDIIKDLMYALNILYGTGVESVHAERNDNMNLSRRLLTRSEKVLKDFAMGKGKDIKVGKIHKIRHSWCALPRDYAYWIELVDKEGNIGHWFHMDSAGVYLGLIGGNNYHPMSLISDKRIATHAEKLLSSIGIHSEIKSIHKLFVPYIVNSESIVPDTPNGVLRVVKMSSGDIYYAVPSRLYGNKIYAAVISLYKPYRKKVIKGLKLLEGLKLRKEIMEHKRKFYQHVRKSPQEFKLRSKDDVRIDDTLKGEFVFLKKVGELFKYNHIVKDKTLIYQRDIK